MKTAIVGDLHFGISSNDYAIDKALAGYLPKFFAYLKENGIRKIIQLGDVFESKKAVHTVSGRNFVNSWLLPIIENDFQLLQIVGNHDCFYNSQTDVNSPSMFFDIIKGKNIQLITEPYHDKESGSWFFPWMEKQKIVDLIVGEDLRSRYLFGHLDVLNFEYQKGIMSTKGISLKQFENFGQVFSGHFHRRSKKENVDYVGSLIPINFSEMDIPHGFYVLEESAGKYEFIDSNTNIFMKLVYREGTPIEVPSVGGKIVKVVAIDVVDDARFKKFLETVESQSPLEVKVVNVEVDKPASSESIEEIDELNMEKLFQIAVDETETVLDRDTLKSFLNRVYDEARVFERSK